MKSPDNLLDKDLTYIYKHKLKMGFNSKTGKTRSGKGLIATGSQRARCTKAVTTQTLGKCVHEPLGKNTK